MSQLRNIIVVGGGAAGLMASIVAARHGARVRIIDRMPRVGKKLLATGAGRCNLCNLSPTPDHYHGIDTSFIVPAIEQFSAEKTVDFFSALGIETRVAPGNRVFPLTGQAANVLDVLRYEMRQLGVEEICDAKVSRIERQNPGFRCLCGDGKTYTADRVILATGGKSSPNLGSNGGGYKLAKALGHKVGPLWPAQVQIKLDAPFLKRLKGIKFTGGAEVRVDGKLARRDEGDVLFTEDGLSGPPILQLSRIVAQHTEDKQRVSIRLDLMPDRDFKEVADLLAKRFKLNAGKPLDIAMIGLINKRMIPYLLRDAGFEDLSVVCGSLQRKELRQIATNLKGWELPAAGTRSWMHSQVTAGGVEVSEVNPRTMESRLVPGIYFAGELLDIDGDCGGYNLQWAWSSGYVAGENAAN